MEDETARVYELERELERQLRLRKNDRKKREKLSDKIDKLEKDMLELLTIAIKKQSKMMKKIAALKENNYQKFLENNRLKNDINQIKANNG